MKLLDFREDGLANNKQIKKRYSATPLGVCALLSLSLRPYWPKDKKPIDWFFQDSLWPNAQLFPRIVNLYDSLKDDSLKYSFLLAIFSCSREIGDDWDASVKYPEISSPYYFKHGNTTEDDLIGYLTRYIIIHYASPITTERTRLILKNILNLIRSEAEPEIKRYEANLKAQLDQIKKLKIDFT